jgi:hypothetical protein
MTSAQRTGLDVAIEHVGAHPKMDTVQIDSSPFIVALSGPFRVQMHLLCRLISEISSRFVCCHVFSLIITEMLLSVLRVLRNRSGCCVVTGFRLMVTTNSIYFTEDIHCLAVRKHIYDAWTLILVVVVICMYWLMPSFPVSVLKRGNASGWHSRGGDILINMNTYLNDQVTHQV